MYPDAPSFVSMVLYDGKIWMVIFMNVTFTIGKLYIFVEVISQVYG